MSTIINVRKESSGSSLVVLESNLPQHFIGPFKADCRYEISEKGSWVSFQYSFKSTIHFQCQRCMDNASALLDVSNTIAICFNEGDAERLMSDFEVVLSSNANIELESIISDELHLSAPIKHDMADCQS